MTARANGLGRGLPACAVGLLVLTFAAEIGWAAHYKTAEERWHALSEPLTESEEHALDKARWQEMSAADLHSFTLPGRDSARGRKALALLLRLRNDGREYSAYTPDRLHRLLAADLGGRAPEVVQYLWLLAKTPNLGSRMEDISKASGHKDKEWRLFYLRMIGELFRAGRLKTDEEGGAVSIPLRVGYEKSVVTALIQDGRQKLLAIGQFPPSDRRRAELARWLGNLKEAYRKSYQPAILLVERMDSEIGEVVDKVVDYPLEVREWSSEQQDWRLAKSVKSSNRAPNARETFERFAALPPEASDWLSSLLERLDPSVRSILFHRPLIRDHLEYILHHPPPPGVSQARFWGMLAAILERGEFNHALEDLLGDIRTVQSVPGIEYPLLNLAYVRDASQALGFLYELHVDAHLHKQGKLDEVGVFIGRAHEVDALAKDGSVVMHKLVLSNRGKNRIRRFKELLREARRISTHLNRSASLFVSHWQDAMTDECCKFIERNPEITFSVHHLPPDEATSFLKFKHLGKTPEPMSSLFENVHPVNPKGFDVAKNGQLPPLEKLKKAAHRMK